MAKSPIPESLKNLKIAVGHDDLTVPYAGGEKVFSAIAETFPKADVFTSMATNQWVERLEERKILTSFMQKIPLKRKLQKALFFLYPLAFESFDFSDYDLVISSSTRFAHGVVTKPETKHLCYMHSPGRMFWESGDYFADSPWIGKVLSPALSYLRLWDRTAAQRVDKFVANSQNIKKKIKKYYGRDAEVVNPFVDLERFVPDISDSEPEDYFLIVTRLVPWKKVDIAIEAAKKTKVKLKIVGSGPDEKRLKDMSFHPEGKRPNVEVLGSVSDEELTGLYRSCRALIMTQEEDFGITSLEAQASGRPVIAYGAGGALETVVEGKTGEFFTPQDPDALADILKDFDSTEYEAKDCIKNARRFSKEEFQKNLLNVVQSLVSA